MRKILSVIMVFIITMSCSFVMPMAATKITAKAPDKCEEALSSGEYVKYSITNTGDLLTMDQDGIIIVSDLENNSSSGLMGSDKVYISKDMKNISSINSLGSYDGTCVYDVLPENNFDMNGGKNVTNTLSYSYKTFPTTDLDFDEGKDTIEFTYSDSYGKRYPEAANYIDTMTDKLSDDVKIDTKKSILIDSQPEECSYYIKLEMTATNYFSDNTKKREYRYNFLTKEEFASEVDALTYYSVPLSDADDLTLLRNGYTPEISGEHFLGSDTTTAPKPVEPEKPKAENIYDNMEEQDLAFDTSLLTTVKDKSSAVNLVSNVVKGMSAGEKTSIKAKDQLAYLSEEVAARSAAVVVADDIVINNETINAADTSNTKNEVASILSNNNVSIKKIRGKARIETTKTDSVSISKESLSNDLDVVEAVTPFAALEFEPDNVSEIKVENKGTNKVAVNFNKNDSTKKVTLKFPGLTEDNYKAVVDDNGNVIGGTYNPITDELSAKISESGVFTVVTNEKDFEDIKNSPSAVQNAIKKLASKGIIKGTSETEFSPDSSITRAEIAALIVRILSADDPNADGGFTDVTRSNWYFGAAGSSKRENVIAGYEDNTFRGTVVIPKVQIDSVIARTLKNRLGYLDASANVLDEFTDNANIPQWAKSDIALETYANMVIKRTDSSYEPNTEMTRGDAALVLEKLFDKVW